MLQQLVEDWNDLTAHDLTDLTEQIPALMGCVSPADVLAAVDAAPDPALGGLLRTYQDGEQRAGRLLLQALLPGLRRFVRRSPASLADYCSQLWCVMGTHDLRTRPRSIAANLLWDTHKAVSREFRWRRWEVTEDIDERTEPVHQPDLDVRDLIDTAADLDLVDELTRAVLTSVYADGLSGKEAAARHDVSHDAIRWRCSKYVRRLAAHRADLLAAVA